MKNLVKGLALVAVLSLVASPAMAQKIRCKNADGPSCGSNVVPGWMLPGQFKLAQARAKKTGRALLIKGVAFGMDRTGATQPTKGHW